MYVQANAKKNFSLSAIEYDSLENELYQMENETEIFINTGILFCCFQY